MSKVLCTRCGELARVIYTQNPGQGRAWMRLDGFIWCPKEASIVRADDNRRLAVAQVSDFGLQNSVIDRLARTNRGATAPGLFTALGAARRNPAYDPETFRDFLNGMVARNLIRLDGETYSARAT